VGEVRHGRECYREGLVYHGAPVLGVERREIVAEQLVIEGGRPLSGTITPEGNKNAALPIMAACLLTDREVRLSNVPRIRDVEIMLDLLVDIGVRATWTGQNDLTLRAEFVTKTALDRELCERIRASILLAGPLLARCGDVDIPPPGGDVIGRRRLDTHLLAFEGLGADAEIGRTYRIRAPEGLRGQRVFLDEPSVTGTENAIMAAVLAPGQTCLMNAACEPHVQDLCRMLVKMGARIGGIGSNMLWIDGVDRLQGCDHRIGADYIEVASFLGLGAVTGGDVTVTDVDPEDLRAINQAFRRLGIEVEVNGTSVRVAPDQSLEVANDLHDQIPKIEDGPWPQFPADLTSIAVAVATQARGTVLVYEKMFENRLVFTDKLVSMGARIVLCDPHRCVVTGPARLYGQRVSSPDIRAGMAMLIAGLCAEGTTYIGDVGQIDRGYERIDERLRALGASIERVNA
jgi:UDP-N-acetylglucosamine 1-carboxyvinyltransferase